MARTRLYAAVGAMLLAGLSAWGKTYDLDESETVDLRGVTAVEFILGAPDCGLCIQTADIRFDLDGSGRGPGLDLGLAGRIVTNRPRAVPSLIVDRAGDRVTVSLYPDSQAFFGFTLGGRATLTAVLPASYGGTVAVTATSEDIGVRDLGAAALTVSASSGDVDVRGIRAGSLSVATSSGNITADDLAADGDLTVRTSSGGMELGALAAAGATLRSSSGDIGIRNAVVTGSLGARASSGDIRAGRLAADVLDLSCTSGTISVDAIEASRTTIEDSSGDIRVTEASGALTASASSGRIDVGFSSVDGPIAVTASSGGITVRLPEDAAFEARLETTSGRISSDFSILGDLTAARDALAGSVNGGGYPLEAKTSSGGISLRRF